MHAKDISLLENLLRITGEELCFSTFSDLYERQGAAQTNFALTLPAPESDLAQELLKSPYDFSFLPGKEKYQEAELKSALIDHITNFLIELGKGFSFVGKVRLVDD